MMKTAVSWGRRMGPGTLVVQVRASLSEGGDASYSDYPACFTLLHVARTPAAEVLAGTFASPSPYH